MSGQGARPYADALDGVRAICIVLTVVTHIETLPIAENGGIGVDIFFALSGWLITCLLLKEQRDTGGVDLRGFYIRRAYRILPLYLITVVAYGVLSVVALLLKSDGSYLHDFNVALLYLMAMFGEYQTGHHPVFYHSWTLGIEEKFYFLWPLLIALFAPRIKVAAAAAVLLASAIIIAYPLDTVIRGYCGLGFGAAWAVTLHRQRDVAGLFTKIGIAPLCIVAIIIVYWLSLENTHSIKWNLIISGFASVMIANLWHNRTQLAARLLGAAPLAYFGKLTFAIYLIHVLVLNVVREAGVTNPWFQLVATYAISMFAAVWLNRLIEQPLIAVGRRLAKRQEVTPAPAQEIASS